MLSFQYLQSVHSEIHFRSEPIFQEPYIVADGHDGHVHVQSFLFWMS